VKKLPRRFETIPLEEVLKKVGSELLRVSDDERIEKTIEKDEPYSLPHAVRANNLRSNR
jgi:hypothetical protein